VSKTVRGTTGSDTDASQVGCGAMLYQYDETGKIKLPIRFMSHVFTAAALNGRPFQRCNGLPLRAAAVNTWLMKRIGNLILPVSSYWYSMAPQPT